MTDMNCWSVFQAFRGPELKREKVEGLFLEASRALERAKRAKRIAVTWFSDAGICRYSE
jgi:hypothetical protein